jgi:hypothetical protein
MSDTDIVVVGGGPAWQPRTKRFASSKADMLGPPKSQLSTTG